MLHFLLNFSLLAQVYLNMSRKPMRIVDLSAGLTGLGLLMTFSKVIYLVDFADFHPSRGLKLEHYLGTLAVGREGLSPRARNR